MYGISKLGLPFVSPFVSQCPSDHFSCRTLRQCCHKFYPAREPLGLVHAGRHPGFDLAGKGGFVKFGRGAGQGFSTNDEGTRLFGAIGAGNTDYSGVEDGGMGEEKRFELGGGNLEGGDFDEVLQS